MRLRNSKAVEGKSMGHGVKGIAKRSRVKTQETRCRM